MRCVLLIRLLMLVCLGLGPWIMGVPAWSAAADSVAAEEVEAAGDTEASGEPVRFVIREFVVSGNTLLAAMDVKRVLEPFTGSEKTAGDVESARVALEDYYHEKGYPTVLVNIPEQRVDEGQVRLVVVESKIGGINVVGNKYFTAKNIMSKLRSLKTGTVLYVPGVQRDLAVVNSNPDLAVAPSLSRGIEEDSTDVELKVTDRLPLHASVEVNNRSSKNTTDLRLNALIRYDNLWQRNHSISFQYQTAPEDPGEVQVFSGSYLMPAPWKPADTLVLYGVRTNSESAFGEGFQTIGEGTILGLRYVMGLPSYEDYSHSLTVGFDYKDFSESVGVLDGGGDDVDTPITYLPFSAAYASSLPDPYGVTRFSAGLSYVYRGLVTDQSEFAIKRYEARGNYVKATGGVERLQELPYDFNAFIKFDGQLTDQPLIDNEQYSAGGMENVRGYSESEVLGDNAVRGSVEIVSPKIDVSDLIGREAHSSFRLYGFYDHAELSVLEPLSGQDAYSVLQSTGLGIRGRVTPYVEYEVDWAYALSSTEDTDRGDSKVHFKVKTQY